MHKSLSFPFAATTVAFGLAGLLALQAEAAASPEAETLNALPQALAGFARGFSGFFLAAMAVTVVLWHRQLAELALHLSARAEARLGFLRRALPQAKVLSPAKRLPPTEDLAAALKTRMTEVHRQLRSLAPELLPPLAEFRAAQNRLLAEIRRNPLMQAGYHAQIIGGLVQVEAATRKLSVVLPSAAKEYALGSYADTLEKLTGETMDGLIGLRAKARGHDDVQLTGDTRHA